MRNVGSAPLVLCDKEIYVVIPEPICASSFDILNDDCLLELIARLNIADVINQSQSSLRLLQELCLAHYRKLNNFRMPHATIDQANVNDIVFKHIGLFIQHVEWDNVNFESLQVLHRNCSNIQTFVLRNPARSVSGRALNMIRQLFSAATKLHLIDCPYFYDSAINAMIGTQARNRFLDMRFDNIPNVNGRFSEVLNTVHTLYIRNCNGLPDTTRPSI